MRTIKIVNRFKSVAGLRQMAANVNEKLRTIKLILNNLQYKFAFALQFALQTQLMPVTVAIKDAGSIVSLPLSLYLSPSHSLTLSLNMSFEFPFSIFTLGFGCRTLLLEKF